MFSGAGKAFHPYKCLATVQNEDNQTVYYKVCQGSEAIDEIKTGLLHGDNSPLPKPSFKPLTKVVDFKLKKTVSDIISTQLSHVKEDCLSNPVGVIFHRQNPRTKKVLCCCGTPSCKNDNLYIDYLTGKSLGIGRGD